MHYFQVAAYAIVKISNSNLLTKKIYKSIKNLYFCPFLRKSTGRSNTCIAQHQATKIKMESTVMPKYKTISTLM